MADEGITKQMESDSRWEPGEGRLNNLDFLRVALATLVILSHSFPISRGGNREIFSVLTQGQTTGGEIAVGGFFVLSGFLITRSWLGSRNGREYLAKRVRRIYPGFLANWLFCLLIVVPLAGGNLAIELAPLELVRNIVRALLFWEPGAVGVFTSNPIPYAINGAMWTIKYEFGCYLGIALLGILGGLTRRWMVLLLTCLVWTALLLEHLGFLKVSAQEVNLSYLLLGNMVAWIRLSLFFLAGAVFYLYQDRIPYSRTLLWISLLALLFTALFPPWLNVTLPVCGVYALLFAAFSPVRGIATIGQYGDFSYGVYLYAFPVQQLLTRFFGNYLNPYTLFLTTLPVVFVLAFISWHLVEKPFLKGKRRAEVKRESTEFMPPLSSTPSDSTHP